MGEIFDTSKSMIQSVCASVATEVPAMMKNDVKEIIFLALALVEILTRIRTLILQF